MSPRSYPRNFGRVTARAATMSCWRSSAFSTRSSSRDRNASTARPISTGLGRAASRATARPRASSPATAPAWPQFETMTQHHDARDPARGLCSRARARERRARASRAQRSQSVAFVCPSSWDASERRLDRRAQLSPSRLDLGCARSCRRLPERPNEHGSAQGGTLARTRVRRAQHGRCPKPGHRTADHGN